MCLECGGGRLHNTAALYTLHSTLYTLHTFAHFPPAAARCCPRQPVSGCWPGARPPPPPLARPPAASPSYLRLRGLEPPQLTSSLQPRGPASLLPRVAAPSLSPRQRDLAVSALSPRVGAGCGLAVSPRWLRASMLPCPRAGCREMSPPPLPPGDWWLLCARWRETRDGYQPPARTPTPHYLAARTLLLRNTADTGHITTEYWITLCDNKSCKLPGHPLILFSKTATAQ